HLQFVEATKGAAGSDFLFKLADIRNGSVLATQHRRVVIDHHRNPEDVARLSDNLDVARRLATEQRSLHVNNVAKRVFYFGTCRFECFYKLDGTAVHDGAFRAVELYENVVNFKPYQGRQRMFNGAYSGTTFLNGRSARYIDDVITVSTDNRGSGQINALEFDSVVGFGRQERHIRLNARVQAYARYSDRFLNCLLFDIKHGTGKSANLNANLGIFQ